MDVYYLGQFPPPYGGVTVKNAVLFDAVSKHISISKMAFKETRTFKIAWKVLSSTNERFLIGFGNAKYQRWFLRFLNSLRPSVLSRCYLVAMGGIFSSSLTDDCGLRNACSKLARIYVETVGMVEAAESVGLSNVVLLPNCRQKPSALKTVAESSQRLQCVFFSFVDYSKGIDLVLAAAEELGNVDFHIYGRIADEHKAKLECEMEALPNVLYHGVFDSVENDAVAELGKYDLHLFPTRWPAEGVPGVLVETKIAAVPSIVSDTCFNAELVRDGIEGIVLTENTCEELVKGIKLLNSDRPLLQRMKAAARESSNRFYVENYICNILADLSEPLEKTASTLTL